ncbi:MAG: hypothetical protein ACRYFS_21520 [Janthinobacterium lividum]
MVSFSISTNMALGFSGALDNKAADHLVALRMAGLHGDRTQLLALRDILKNPNPGSTLDYITPINQIAVFIALHALAELGDTDALPIIDQLIAQNPKALNVVNYAEVQRARLLVETNSMGTTGNQAQLPSEINQFFATLALSPSDLNAGTKHYQYQLHTEPQGAGNGTPCPVEVYAMRELADMAYQSHAQEFQSIPGVSQVDFSLDYPSALKIRLAPLSDEARINSLIDSLVHARILGPDEDYLMQLLADGDLAASQAIADRLGEVKKHRDHYREINISALFRVLGMIGDPKQSLVVTQFQSDPDISVRQEAEVESRELQSGLASLIPRTVGY